MTNLEIILYPFLVFGFGAICYMCGKGDLLKIIPLMLQDKLKELQEKLEGENDNADKNSD